MASERDVKLVQAGIEAAKQKAWHSIEVCDAEGGNRRREAAVLVCNIDALNPAAIVAEMGLDAMQHDFEQVGKVVRSILIDAKRTNRWQRDEQFWQQLLDRLRGIDPLLPGEPKAEVKR